VERQRAAGRRLSGPPPPSPAERPTSTASSRSLFGILLIPKQSSRRFLPWYALSYPSRARFASHDRHLALNLTHRPLALPTGLSLSVADDAWELTNSGPSRRRSSLASLARAARDSRPVDPGAVVDEELASEPGVPPPEAWLVAATVASPPPRPLALWLRFPSHAAFRLALEAQQFREAARSGRSWSRTGEALRHQEAWLSERMGLAVDALPLRFASAALSAQAAADDLAGLLRAGDEDRQPVRRLAERWCRDTLASSEAAQALRGWEVRVRGKLTAGMATGFSLRAGATTAGDFPRRVDRGIAHAQTRLGVVGVTVRLHPHPPHAWGAGSAPSAGAARRDAYWASLGGG